MQRFVLSPAVFTRLSINIYGRKEKEKEGSLLISMWWACSIDKSDYYTHSFSTSGINIDIKHSSTEFTSSRIPPFAVRLVNVVNSFPERYLLCTLSRSSKGSMDILLLGWVSILVAIWHELTKMYINQCLQLLNKNEEYLNKH